MFENLAQTLVAVSPPYPWSSHDKADTHGLGRDWVSMQRVESPPAALGSEDSPAARNTLDSAQIPRASTGFARRLFYALSGFNHDANFVTSSSPTVI